MAGPFNMEREKTKKKTKNFIRFARQTVAIIFSGQKKHFANKFLTEKLNSSLHLLESEKRKRDFLQHLTDRLTAKKSEFKTAIAGAEVCHDISGSLPTSKQAKQETGILFWKILWSDI
jgi:hypothetical protein